MRVILELQSGHATGKKIPITPGQTLRIGRNPKADHSFPDDRLMSSLHFAIDYGEKGCRILDLQSSNGTFLNGARVKEAALANGDEIRAGNTVFVVRMLPDEALPDQSPAKHPSFNKPLPRPHQLPACTAACLLSPLALPKSSFSQLRRSQLPIFLLLLHVNHVFRTC
jgi:predicted component of type VI protein secretion system